MPGLHPAPPGHRRAAADRRGDHPERLHSESSRAHLCGAAPIPASSGKVSRHRLNRGGDRQASHALWRIVITRLGSRPGHPATRAYVTRRTKEGLPEKEIIRCLKRYVAREVCRQLRAAPDTSSRGGLARYSAAARRAGLRSICRPPRDPLQPADLGRVAPAHCCAGAPSEPRRAAFTAPGSSRRTSRGGCMQTAALGCPANSG